MKGKFISLISQMVKSAGLFKLVVRYDSFILVSFFIDLLIDGWQSPSKTLARVQILMKHKLHPETFLGLADLM